MLYDQRRDATLSNLIGWLETKNPNQNYDYWDVCGNCILGQFFNYIGLEWRGTKGPGFKMWQSLIDNDKSDHVNWTNPLLKVSQSEPHTFGAALERARALA